MKRTKTKKGDRRYPIGKHPDYDFAYQKAYQNSPILNISNTRNINSSYLSHHPETGILELEGDSQKDNFFKQGNNWILGRIPKAKNDLADVHKRFQNWQNEQVRNGRSLMPPTEWPESLLTLRLSKEGILDVLGAEANILKQKIKDREDAKEKKRLDAILKDGPIGNFGGQMNMVDGQKISHSADGVPYIDEPFSKYSGMPIFYYKQMAENWMRDIGVDNQTLFEERNEQYKQACIEAIRNDEEPIALKPSIKKMRAAKIAKISPNDYPDWPDGAKRVNEIGK